MSDSNKTQKKELIDTVELKPLRPGNHARHDEAADSDTSRTLIWSGLVVLLILAITVIFFLPKAVNKNVTKHEPSNKDQFESGETQQIESEVMQIIVEQKVQQQEPTGSQEEQIKDKAEAESLIARLISLEAKLQNHAVEKWAPEDYAQGVELGRVGDEYFRQRQYAQAIVQFNSAIEKLEGLEQRIQPTLELALMRGEQALAQADQATATQQFELAKAIDSKNIKADNGLQRASTIKELFTILRRASSFESHSQLQQAKLTYQQAVALDPLSEEAESSLARVENKLTDEAFEQTIKTAYRALQNGQYSDARAAFNSAKTIKPDYKQVEAGLNKVAQAMRQEKIANTLYEARHFADLQQWQQAATSYEKVLQLDSKNVQARQGMELSQTKANILTELKASLESADQLYKDKVLEKAEDLLLRIEGLESPGSKIEDQYVQLRQLVDVATTPISITLESDSQTEVTVLKVARLGEFNQHQLQLRPGPYTIIGTRNGYRDVRITIRISPESSHSKILIRCEEAI
jgi:hypothetical protein